MTHGKDHAVRRFARILLLLLFLRLRREALYVNCIKIILEIHPPEISFLVLVNSSDFALFAASASSLQR